eukprot:CAMPEP_0119524940 /NCGR_PEP_ID=MMETSP1344-20130328/39812_1 /TAXON_ID=236787 /ORGANISM="Florenciella parvula, Strain CCMP2471" /LENGTH=67 /DNA_ID=CAMNT_0007563581 /DNA_START=114 /DNA_END=313 /DNA_ORIENTATION=-
METGTRTGKGAWTLKARFDAWSVGNAVSGGWDGFAMMGDDRMFMRWGNSVWIAIGAAHLVLLVVGGG